MEYTIDMDFLSLDGAQTGEWMLQFLNMVDCAFKNYNNYSRLLGNLLIMERYIHTLCQGLAASNKKISIGLECACNLLWDFLERSITPSDFQDFANDYYACLIAYNVGDIHTDAPKEFYNLYFADATPDAYELLAIEWSSGLLMQLVSIAGGRVDFDDFEECEQIDFYGIDIMLHILEDACIELTNTPCLFCRAKDLEKAMEQVHQTPLFQKIIKDVQDDIQIALKAVPSEFASLRNKYRKYTIIPEKYAAELLEY